MAPQPAANVGYNTRTYGPNISIGSNWFRANWPGVGDPNAINVVTNADGSVTIAGGNNTFNEQLTTVAQVVGGTPNWTGQAFGGGAYFHATLKWTGTYSNVAGWPAWWGDGFEAIIDPNNTSGGRNRWIETDFMEYTSSATSWAGFLHDWIDSTGNPQVNNGGYNLPSGVLPSDYHTYGMLWVPATGSTQGYCKWYFDNVQVGSTISWNQGVGPYGDFLDTHHLALFLGTSTANPMTVSQVEVWQASGANNIPITTTTTTKPRITAPLTGTVTTTAFTAQDLPASAAPGLVLPSGKLFHYEIMVPSQYSTSFLWPLMIWLHPDQSGNAWYQGQASTISVNDAAPQYKNVPYQTNYPSICVVPYADQTTNSSEIQNWGGWINTGGTGSASSFNGETGPNVFALNYLVQYLLTQYSIDPTRVYVNGFSLGGIGAEYLMLRYNQVNGNPKLYTAGTSTGGVLEIHGFGAGPNATDVATMTNVPVWWVSGQNDGTSIPTDWNTKMWQQLAGNSNYPGQGASESASRAGSSQMHFSYAAGVGHSPTNTSGVYMESTSTILNWLFAQQGVGAGTGSFYVANGQIIAPDGTVFIAAGINVRSPEFSNAVTNAACQPLTTLFPGINIVRLAYEGSQSPYTTATMTTIVDRLTALKIVAVIEDHTSISAAPYTGTTLSNELAWYSSLATTYKNNPYVWFGTLNEPGQGNGTDLAAIASQQVSIYNAIRTTGNNNNIILLEEPSGGNVGLCGKMTPASSYAAMTNVVWDLHMYGYIVNRVTGSFSTDIPTIKTVIAGSVSGAYGVAGCQVLTSRDGVVPVIIGECGDSTDGSSIDANGSANCAAIGQMAGAGTSGYMFWDWINNGGTPGDKLTDGAGHLNSPYGTQVAGLIVNTTSTSPANFTPSPNNTVILAPSTALITNSTGVTFGIVGGQVSINGSTDPTTSNVVELAYVNNVVWQKNSAGNWYSYLGTPGNYSAGTTTSPLPTISPSGSFITAPTSSVLTDSLFNSWGITSGGSVTKNGTNVTTPGGAVVLTPTSGGSIKDGANNTWTLTSAGVATENGSALPNGVGNGTGALTVSGGTLYGQDAATGNWYTWNGTAFISAPTPPPLSGPPVVQLAYVNSLIWEKDNTNNWYSTNPSNTPVTWAGPTTTSPLSSVPGGLSYILPMKQAGLRVITYIKQQSPSGFVSGLASLRAQQAANLDIFAYEGCQEPDTATLVGTPETLADAASFQPNVKAAGQADGLPVIQTSFGVRSNYGTTGNLAASATYGNAHVYPGVWAPDDASTVTNGFLTATNTAALLTSPGLGIAHTEFGWTTTVNNQAAVAAYVLDYIMSGYFNLNLPYMLVNGLFDDTVHGAVGLFNSDLTPRTAATALANFYSLLKDTGSNALSFGPGKLQISFSNLPTPPAGSPSMGGNFGVLQKSDGSFWVMVRNQQTLTTTANQPITVAPVTSVMTLGTLATSVAVFDPMISQTAVQTAINTSGVSFSLPARPILIKVVRP